MAVLVTRPDEKGKQLVEMLAKAGIAAIHFPLFSIQAGRELNDLPRQLNQLNAGDYVFVVSQNAVSYSAESLKQAGFQWRADLHYFTVGQRTALLFSSQTEQNIHYPFQQETSEGVLSLSAMKNLHDKTILILRGNGGRAFFAEQASLRGATIQTLECYRREPLVYEPVEQTSMLKRAGITTILATSKEILCLLLDFVPKNEHNWLKSCRLITVSERIQRFAFAMGWEKVDVSPRADNVTLCDTLLQFNEF
ncbi:uroporphyrinogen-III synthase [Avibacterium endocarditidis]|uniref:Uroporphyrinogen-III synthase n=1 Tax=Avibacterium endocarditidis TaxID=380674 RepID=A0ABX4ZV75_9PAST|nr:uroporphyrinogen-III synthase [Avibacterium endocarditidis]POY43085.1 uroporphyrinogen-III synthase [Avibacterium endocarditidis]